MGAARRVHIGWEEEKDVSVNVSWTSVECSIIGLADKCGSAERRICCWLGFTWGSKGGQKGEVSEPSERK
jgi:hypothetical protein